MYACAKPTRRPPWLRRSASRNAAIASGVPPGHIVYIAECRMRIGVVGHQRYGRFGMFQSTDPGRGKLGSRGRRRWAMLMCQRRFFGSRSIAV